MSEYKFLYGASVQGIQGFIFQTNELKDIVGASELVENICTEMFKPYGEKGTIVVNAAGNVKCIFSKKEDCELAVRYFPKSVMEKAPGITISQAVVKLQSDESDFKGQVEKLEQQLHAQRNKPLRRVNYGPMAALRSRKTGFPAVKVVNNKDNVDFLDEATVAKREFSRPDLPENSTLRLAKKSFGNENLSFKAIAYDIGDLTDKNEWIAIIHADGNALGQVVATKNNKPGELKDFSEKLDAATVKAAQQAFAEIVKSPDYCPKGSVVPFRPVVLGGDDMTVICRASLAMRYVTSYIRHFEENTLSNGKENALTACAGIAYMKSSYPFHYGYRLAEALCEEAKKDAKREDHLRKDGKAPSCIMFHKIQGSYVSNFSQIERDELTINSKNSLKFGPYYLKQVDGETRWTINELRNNVARLVNEKEDGNTAKTDIRQWLTLMHEDTDKAFQKEKRVHAVASHHNDETFRKATSGLMRSGICVYPAYDMLQLLTVENQITKEEDNE